MPRLIEQREDLLVRRTDRFPLVSQAHFLEDLEELLSPAAQVDLASDQAQALLFPLPGRGEGALLQGEERLHVHGEAVLPHLPMHGARSLSSS